MREVWSSLQDRAPGMGLVDTLLSSHTPMVVLCEPDYGRESLPRDFVAPFNLQTFRVKLLTHTFWCDLSLGSWLESSLAMKREGVADGGCSLKGRSSRLTRLRELDVL